MDCSECKLVISSEHSSLGCYGFCGKKFHFDCVAKRDNSYKKAIIDYLTKIPNLQWFCDDCIPLTINGVHSSILTKIQKCSDDINMLAQIKITQLTNATQQAQQSTSVNVSDLHAPTVSQTAEASLHGTQSAPASQNQTVPLSSQASNGDTHNDGVFVVLNDTTETMDTDELNHLDQQQNESTQQKAKTNKRKLNLSQSASQSTRQQPRKLPRVLVNNEQNEKTTQRDLSECVLESSTPTDELNPVSMKMRDVF